MKICDFDLASGIDGLSTPVTTPELQTPVGFQVAKQFFRVTFTTHSDKH